MFVRFCAPFLQRSYFAHRFCKTNCGFMPKYLTGFKTNVAGPLELSAYTNAMCKHKPQLNISQLHEPRTIRSMMQTLYRTVALKST
jgi:hypothetical protein